MSDFLKRLIEQAEDGWDWDGELAELVKVTPTEKNTVKRDVFDKMSWGGMLGSVERLAEEVDRIEAEYAQSPAAMEDLFNLLYQGDPGFVSAEVILPEYLANLDLLRELSESAEFQALREETRYDDYAAVFALLSMEDDLRKAFARVQDKRERQAQAAAQEQQAQEALQEAMQAAQDAAQSGQGQQQAGEALQQAMGDAQAAQAQAQAAAAAHDAAAQDAVVGMAGAAQRAKAELDGEKEMMAAHGLGDGDLQRMSFGERKALAERIKRSRMAKFAKMIGSTREFANAERRRKIKHAPEEFVDFEVGNDLTRLAPSEVVNLAIPEIEELFWLRHARHQLLLRKKGSRKLRQGPIVVVCDESWSMTTPLDTEGNTREAWSKAITLSLLDQAKRGGRDFYYIGFASPNEQWRLDCPKGVAPIEKVLEFTEHFFGGGTEYERPLTMALELIEEALAQGRDRPDVVFLTDDECMTRDEFVETFREARVRADAHVYGIQLGPAKVSSTMRALCDRVIPVSSLVTLPEAAKDLFRQI